MIKAVIFDNYGVLATSNEESVFPAVAKLLNDENQFREFKKVYLATMGEVDLGKTSSYDFFENISKKIKSPIEATELLRVAYGSFEERPGIRELVAEVKDNYMIAILSDAPEDLWTMAQDWSYMKEFPRQNVYISAETGLVKPSSESYQNVLSGLAVKPAEAVFIDDNLLNVQAAIKLGIRGIHFTSLEKLRAELKNLLK